MQHDQISTTGVILEESVAPQAGLQAEFFALAPWSVTQLADIDFTRDPDATGTWEVFDIHLIDEPFWEGGPRDHFAARYTGNLTVAEGGSYTFYLTSDDGSALYLDGARVIDNDGQHGARERRVTLDLEPGTHAIELLYFELGGRQTLRLEWSGPDSGGTRSLVDGTALTHDTSLHPEAGADGPGADTDQAHPAHADPETPAPAPGLQAEFFALAPWSVTQLADIDFTRDPDATGTWEVFDMYRTDDPFWQDGPRDHFAARYIGNLNVSEGGDYTFYLTSDDGSALFLNGMRVIDNDGAHATRERRVTLELEAGTHEIELLYFELGGVQTLRLEWSGPDNGGERSLMDGTALTHDTSLHPEAPEEVAHPSGLQADFFALETPVSSLSEIDFTREPDATGTWQVFDMYRTDDPFWEGGPRDHFAARFNGGLNVVEGGVYAFYLTSDDGSALYINGERVIDNDGLHATQERIVRLDLAPGTHEIALLYFERTGVQTLRLEWLGPDSGYERSLIEGDSLVRPPAQTDQDGYGGQGDDSSPGPGAAEGGQDDDPPHHQDETAPADDDAGQGEDHHAGGDDDAGQGDDHHAGGDDDAGQGGDHHAGGDDDAEQGDDYHAGGDDDAADPHDDHAGHDHGDHHDHGTPAPPQRSEAEIEAFVQAVMAEQDHHGHHLHPGNDRMAAEHGQLLDLVPRSEATHVAIGDGDWFEPATWYQGRIPDADARVLIPKGVCVTYDGESDAALFTVRIDGTLGFATDRDTRMVVDTMVVSDAGRLEIGTAERPVAAGVNAQVVIADNGDIDVAWDPALLSRGVLSLGSVEMHGAEKTAFLKVSEAPMQGDTMLHLAEAPTGWQVGDTLVISGTHKTRLGHESQDEVVTITAIDGNAVTFDRALIHDHDTPRDDLFAYVANMTRNITFESESGADSAAHHRGHVMLMHNEDVDVRYAAFDHLGRTDKSEPAFDTGALDTIAADSNIKGRYSFHFHLTGSEDLENPAVALGNTVTGSIGWAFVHHSSHADFIENVAFDVFGAAFAAEDGDETGIWLRNMAINVEGVGWGDWGVKRGGDVGRHDNGRDGEGFFFAGRLVEAAENVAVNTTHGFVWMTRSAPAALSPETVQHPTIAYGRDSLSPSTPAIQGFRDNEAFGTEIGLIVVKSNPNQGHDVRSVMDGFVNWETRQGVNLSYSAEYTLLDFDLIAAQGIPSDRSHGHGITLGNNSRDLVVNDFRVEGFHTGVTFNGNSRDHILIDGVFIDNQNDFRNFDPDTHSILASDDLEAGRLHHDPADVAITSGQNIRLSGTTTDSIGSFERDVGLHWWWQVAPLIAEKGYYSTADGQNVLLVPDIVADRATGEILMFTQVLTLDMSHSQIQNDFRINRLGGTVYHGQIDLDGQAPAVQENSASVLPGQALLIDVLANDVDLDGGSLRVGGLTDPGNGDVFLQEDGQILYQPNHGFSGTDSFDYWAVNDTGLFSRSTVTIDVWDM